MLIGNLGALGMDAKKKRPLLADKGTGEKDLNFENENGEIRRGSPKGPKVYKFTASLANGMDIDFESDRDLTDDEIQGVVNEYSKTPGYQQVAQKYAKDKGARASTPTSELGPYDNRRIQETAKANNNLKNELIRKTTQGLARAGYNPALTPAEDPRSGFQKALVGESETSRLLSENATNLVNDPINTSLGKALGTGGLLGPTLKMFGANQQADALEGFLSSAANPANLSGIAPLMQAAANPAQAADEGYYNAFDTSLPWEQRIGPAINIALGIYALKGGMFPFKGRNIPVTPELRKVAQTFRGNPSQVSLQEFADKMEAAWQTTPELPMGNPKSRLGEKALPGRGPVVEVPPSGTPQLPMRTRTGRIQDRNPNVSAPIVVPPVVRPALGTGAQPLPQPATPFPGQKYGLVPTEPPVAPNTTRPVVAREPGVEPQYGQKPGTQKTQTKALPGRTPEPAPVAVQPKPKASVGVIGEPGVTLGKSHEGVVEKVRGGWDYTDVHGRQVSFGSNVKTAAQAKKAAEKYFTSSKDVELYHSAPESAQSGIKSSGLRASQDGDLGPGVYLGDRSSIDSWSSQLDDGTTSRRSIPVTTNLGKSLHIVGKNPLPMSVRDAVARLEASGFSRGAAINRAAREAGYDSIVKSHAFGDEYLVFDPKRVKPTAQPKPEAPSVVAKAAEPKVETPAPTPKEPAAAKGKEPWEMDGASPVFENAYMVEADRLARGMRGRPLDDSWVTVDGQPKLVKGLSISDKTDMVRQASDAIRARLARGEEPELLAKINKAVADKARLTVEVKLSAGAELSAKELADYPDLAAKYKPGASKPVAKVETPVVAPKTGLDAVIQAGEDASARLKKGGTGNKNRQRGASGIGPEDLRDLAIVIAGHMARGAKTVASFAEIIKREHPNLYGAFLKDQDAIINLASRYHNTRLKPFESKNLVDPRQILSNKEGIEPPYTVSTKGILNEKTNQQTIRNVQEGQGIRDQGEQPQGQGNGQKANAKKEVTVEPPPVIKTGEPIRGAAISNKFFKDQTDADVPDADKQTVQQWIDAAIGAGHNTEAGTKKLVDDVLGGKKRDFTESEGMGIAARLTDLLTEKGTKGIDPARKTAIEAEIQRIAEATKKTGTNQARAFVARAMLVGHDYSPEGVYRSYELAGGKSPTIDIKAQLDAAIQRNAELTKLLDAKEKGATVTKGDIALLDEVARQRGKVRKVQDAQERLDAIRAKRAAGARGMGPSSGKGPRVRGALDFGDVADLKELAGAYAQMGVAKFQHFVDKVRGDFKEEFAHLSDADIAEALSQKTGDARTLEQKLIQQNVARLKREAQYIDQGASRLTKPAQQLRQVQKQIADVQSRIDSGNVKTKPMTPPELKAARSELAKLKAQEQMIATNASKPTKAAVAAEREAKRIESQQAKLDAQIADIKKRLDANDLSTPPGKPKKPADPALKSRLDELTKLRAEMEVKRKAARDAAKPPKVANDPVAKELERIRKESEAIQARIDAGTPKGPDPSKPVDPAVAYARQEINKLRAQERDLLKASEAGFDRKNIDQWRNIQKKIAQTEYRIESGNVRGSKVRDTPEVIKEQQKILADLLRQEKMLADGASSKTKDTRYREQVQKQINDYENQLKTGVYKDRSKAKMRASVELENLRARRDLARQEIDAQLGAAKAKAEYDAKSWGGKRAHDFREVTRGLVLGADLASSATQGAYHLLPSPKQSALSFWGGLKAATSDAALRTELANVVQHPNYAIKVKSGLNLNATLGGHSSEFSSTSVIKLPVYKQSNRFLDAQLTLLRSRLWDKYEGAYRRMSKVADGQPLTAEDYALISEQVNTTTGAGTGEIARAFQKLSDKSGGTLLAPGYRVSRVKQALASGFFNAAVKQRNFKMARLFLQDHLIILGGIGATAAALKANGVDVELDPRSTDFMNARRKSQRHDLSLGMVAPLRALNQAYAGFIASKSEGEKSKGATTFKAEGAKSFIDYMVSSLAPHVQLINQVAKQTIQRGYAWHDKQDQRDLEFKDFGKNIDLTTKDGLGEFLMNITPVTAQQIKDITEAKDLTPEQKALNITGAILGVSAKIKEEKPEETKEQKTARLHKKGTRIFDLPLK